jgi:hypothetical protein
MMTKYLAAAAALGTAVASAPAPAMPVSNLAATAPTLTDNVRYCRHRGCGRVYVRRYVPAYSSYYYDPYVYAPYYGSYGYAPSISFGFGFGPRFGFGGWGHRGRW